MQEEIHPQVSETRTIKRRVDKELNFFTDPDSPYKTLSNSFKYIFGEENDKTVKINKPIIKFEPKPGGTNICTKFFPNGVSYYTCKQCCCQTKPGVTMCFCESCWQPAKHIGHTFTKNMSSGGAYCDCGRQSRIKPQSFCCTHADKSQKNIEYNETEKAKFTSYYQSLFMCYFYLRANEQTKRPDRQLEVMFNQQIEELCTDSMYYTNLMTEILSKPIQIQSRPVVPMLQNMLNYNKNCDKMMFALISSDVFKYQLIKTINKLKKEGWQPENLKLIISEQYETDDIFFRFAADDDFIRNKNDRYIEMALRSNKGVELLKDYLKYEKKVNKPEDWITFVVSMFSSTSSFNFLLSHQQICLDTLKDVLDQFAQQSLALDQMGLLVTLASTLIFCLSNADIEHVSSFLKQQNNSALTQSLNNFVNFAIKNMRFLVMKIKQDKQFWLMIPLILLSVSENKSQQVSKLWHGFMQNDPDLRQVLVQILNAIYNLSAIISNSPGFFNNLKFQKTEKNIQEKQYWMKCFLYENRPVPKAEVVKCREKGYFDFKNAGQIIKKLCKYVESREVFEYVSQEKYPNILMRFKSDRKNKEINNISMDNFSLSDQLTTAGLPSYVQEIFILLFGSKSFINQLGQNWDKKFLLLGDANLNFWKNFNLSAYYIFTLVYAHILCKKKNIELRQKIESISSDPQLLKKLYECCNQPRKIDGLLQIKKEQEKQQKEEQKQMISETSLPDKVEQSSQSSKNILAQMKRKLIEKKKKISEKYSKSNEKILGSNNIIQQSEQSLQCMICRESGRVNDKLMHVGSLEKNASIFYSLYGDEDKSEINISSCLHPIHFSCFTAISKSGFDFNCPLCTKKSNIYIPIDPSDKISRRRCGNLINALQVVKYKNHDFGLLLMPFIRHLVGNYGLNSLIFDKMFESEKKRMRKVDRVLLQMSCELASYLKQDQKSQLQDELSLFVDNIKKCKKEELSAVQLLFANAIFNKILKRQSIVDPKLVQHVYHKIAAQQYERIKQSLEDLAQNNLQLPQFQQKPGNIRTSIGFRSIFPPQTAQAMKQYQFKECDICQKQNCKILCLLCKKLLCQQCLAHETHKSQHNSNNFCIQMSSKKLHVRQLAGKTNGNFNIYFDAFMSPFQDSIKYKSEEVHELNRPRFEKILMSFLLRN